MVKEYIRDQIIEENETTWGGVNRLSRCLFYKKISVVDISFLGVADESIIRKFEIYQVMTIVRYFILYPTILNFPVMGLLSIALMTYYITYFTLVALSLFVVLSIFLYFVIQWQSSENLK